MTASLRPARAVLVALLLALGLLAGCTNETPATPGRDPHPRCRVGTVTTDEAGVQEITLETGDDYVFTPEHLHRGPGRGPADRDQHGHPAHPQLPVHRGRRAGAIAENIPLLAPGDSQTIEFTVTTPGDYPFECSFHTALGQVGTMTVSG